jgi:hypothetical protein
LPETSAFATNSAGQPQFSFEGYIEEGIKLVGTAAFTDTLVSFSEFSTLSAGIELSEKTKIFYDNISNENEEIWGELIVDIPFKDSNIPNEETQYPEGTLLWYNPINDVST